MKIIHNPKKSSEKFLNKRKSILKKIRKFKFSKKTYFKKIINENKNISGILNIDKSYVNEFLTQMEKLEF